MRDGKRGKRWAGLAIAAMLSLAAYFAIFGGDYTVFQLHRLEDMERTRAAKLAETEAVTDSLERLERRLESDPASIERVARERYGMIRDDETLYRFRDEPSDSSGAEKPSP